MPRASWGDAAPVRATCKVTDLAQVPLSMSSSNFLNDMSQSLGPTGRAVRGQRDAEDSDLRTKT